MKLLFLSLSLIVTPAFAEKSSKSDSRSNTETLYCSGTYSTQGNTRKADGVEKVKTKFWRKHNDSEHAHFVDRDGAKDGFEGLVYLNDCRHGGFEGQNSTTQERRQNKSKE